MRQCWRTGKRVSVRLFTAKSDLGFSPGTANQALTPTSPDGWGHHRVLICFRVARSCFWVRRLHGGNPLRMPKSVSASNQNEKSVASIHALSFLFQYWRIYGGPSAERFEGNSKAGPAQGTATKSSPFLGVKLRRRVRAGSPCSWGWKLVRAECFAYVCERFFPQTEQ